MILMSVVIVVVREFLADGCLSEINVSAEIKKQCTKDLVTPDRYAFTTAKVSPLLPVHQMVVITHVLDDVVWIFIESSILFDERRYLSTICEVGVLQDAVEAKD